jgi:hypothetical protein
LRGTIEIGDLVWNGHGGWLRFGTVTNKRISDDGWAYYTVDWHNDERYQNAQDCYSSFNSNVQYGLTEFKTGQVWGITPERLEQILESYKNHNS